MKPYLKKQITELEWKDKRLLMQEFLLEASRRAMEEVGETEQLYTPIMDYWTAATERKRRGVTGLTSGIENFDHISGGLDPEELIIITGETGIGKTNLAMNIMANVAASGSPVLFFSLEMSQLEVTHRFQGLYRTDQDAAAHPIFLYSAKMDVTVDTLRAAIKSAVTVHGVKLVCIDHLHYFTKSASDYREQLEIITREVKLMAREFQIPIILIAHTRKLTGTNTRPMLSDIKDTSGVAQDADQVVIVWKEQRDRENKILRFDVAKNRLKGNCAEGKLKITQDYKLIPCYEQENIADYAY